MTLDTLQNQITTDIYNKTAPGSITNEQVAALLSSITAELLSRGIAKVTSVSDLANLNSNDYKTAIVEGLGVFSDTSAGPADGVNVFPGVGGRFWKKQLGADSFKVTTVSALRSMSDPQPGMRYYTLDSGIQREWYYDAADTTSADNTGTILVSGSRRFKAVYDTFVQASWFGVTANGTTDDTAALQAAFDFQSRYGKGAILYLPSGRIRITSTINMGYAANTSLSNGMKIWGAGQTNGQAGGAGTVIYWDGPEGPGTSILNVSAGAYRFWDMRDILLMVQFNDAVETGLNFQTVQSSTFSIRNVNTGDRTNAPTIGVKFTVAGGGANAEFNQWDRVGFVGTKYGFQSDSFQSVSTKFNDCSGLCQWGGAIVNYVKSAGGQFKNCDMSGGVNFANYAASTTYIKGRYVRSNGNMYRARNAGTTGVGSAPTGTTAGQVDGGITWDYMWSAFHGSTLIRLGGSQPDAVAFFGGRMESVCRLVEFLTDTDKLRVKFDSMTMAVPERIMGTQGDFVTLSDSITGDCRVYGVNCIFYSGTVGDGSQPLPTLLQINPRSCISGDVLFEKSTFVKLNPVFVSTGSQQNATSNTSGLAQTSQFKALKVEVKDCLRSFTTGVQQKNLPFSKVLWDGTPMNAKTNKPENLLLQSRFNSATGAVAPLSPWVSTDPGNLGTFDSLLNMNIGDTTEINPFGVRARFRANQKVYQDIQGVDITAPAVNIVNYKAKVALSKAGLFTFALVNSLDESLIYDVITVMASSETLSFYKYFHHTIDLTAYVGASQTGSVRLVLLNNAASIVWVEFFYQHVFTTFGASFYPTTTTPVLRTQEWDISERAAKFLTRLQIPYIPDAFGSGIANNVTTEREADVYVSQETNKLRVFGGDSWQTMPRMYSGTAAPTTGTYNRGDLVFHPSPSAGAAAAWMCTTGGTDGAMVWKVFSTLPA